MRIALILLWMTLIPQVMAETVNLTWAPPTTGPAPDGYAIYYGTASGSYGTPLMVGAVTAYSLTTLTNGTWFIALKSKCDTCSWDGGPTESVAFSNEVSTTLAAQPQIFTLWPNTTVPGSVAGSDASAVNLGVVFSSTMDGTITGIRFYKEPDNLGTHAGTLWSSTGTLLASASFTDETASGWQQANFATPVVITAGTTYVASYRAPVGRYSGDVGYFNAPYIATPLRAINSVYIYGDQAFPTQNYNNTNYWVDVVFQPSTPINIPTLSPPIIYGPELLP